MKFPDLNKSEIGLQRRKDSGGRLLHCCCICGVLDTWGPDWSYYGSYAELENGEAVAKFCSPICCAAGGEDAASVTPEMKAAAKNKEWREPTIVYREATDREKFRAAFRAQRSRSLPQ